MMFLLIYLCEKVIAQPKELIRIEVMKHESKLYQVLFCDCRLWKEDYWKFMESTNWYLLECPLIGIKDLDTARLRAIELKRKYGKKVQVVIIGEKLRKDFRTLDADNLYGISALRGAGAKEECPSWIFEREEIEKELAERLKKSSKQENYNPR